jgi:exonuclease III
LALTEFQTRNESSMRSYLEQLGYPFIATSNPAPKQNGLLIASKWQLDHSSDQDEPDIDRERWLAVRLPELDLDVLVLHIPGTPDKKFDGGYGISGAKRKELLWEHTLTYADTHKDRRAIVMGDFNTGFRIDTEGAMFALSGYMTKLMDIGFIDTWRCRHPHTRDYTWYSNVGTMNRVTRETSTDFDSTTSLSPGHRRTRLQTSRSRTNPERAEHPTMPAWSRTFASTTKALTRSPLSLRYPSQKLTMQRMTAISARQRPETSAWAQRSPHSRASTHASILHRAPSKPATNGL